MLSSSSTTRMLAAMGSWCCWPDSNGRPTDYESVALPTELQQHFLAGAGGANYTPPIVMPLSGREVLHAILRRIAPFGSRFKPLVAGFCDTAWRSLASTRKKRGLHEQHQQGIHHHRGHD